MRVTSLLRALLPSAFALGVLCHSGSARAAGGGEVVSITFNPVRLLVPLFEAQAELRLTPGFAVAAIAGIGDMKAADIHFTAAEVGGQLVIYPLYDFRSLQLGAEVLWIHLGGGGHGITGDASGVAVAPFAGYKLITRAGFTFSVQGGPEFFVAKASAHDTAGTSVSVSGRGVGLLLNLNFGWSF